MITVCDVWKSFKHSTVLSGTSLYIKPGETVGLLGANGAGKTTLFRIMCGLMKPESGAVYIKGLPVSRIHSGILSVFFGGSARVYDRLTARENISYFGKLNRVSPGDINKRIDHFADILDMNAYLDRKSQNFSHGMKQKTALVRMTVTNPDILLLDEPTTGMDIPSIESVLHFVRACAQQKKTIIYSSHSVSELEQICDRILILHNGKITDNFAIKRDNVVLKSDTEEIYLNRIG